MRQRNYISDDVIHIFSTNAETDNNNTEKLNSIPTEQVISSAQDIIKAVNINDETKTRYLAAAKNFKISQSQSLCYFENYTKYMMTVNVNTSDGLVNGATGILKEISFNTGGSANILWIRFFDESVGINARPQLPHRVESTWTPIQKILKNVQYHSNETVTIDRKQFPLVPAVAITIHKSQGATYDKVAIYTTSRMKRPALYVGCSRATSAAGLYIVGQFVPPQPDTDTSVIGKLQNLRSNLITMIYLFPIM